MACDQADWWEPMILKGEHDTIDPGGLARSDNYYGWAKIACESWCLVRREPETHDRKAASAHSTGLSTPSARNHIIAVTSFYGRWNAFYDC